MAHSLLVTGVNVDDWRQVRDIVTRQGEQRQRHARFTRSLVMSVHICYSNDVYYSFASTGLLLCFAGCNSPIELHVEESDASWGEARFPSHAAADNCAADLQRALHDKPESTKQNA